MHSRSSQVAVGVAFYVLLVLALYGMSLIAFPDNGGPIAWWFGPTQVLFEAAASVIPGFVVGWLARERGFLLGALTGAAGGVLGNAIQLLLLGLAPPGEFGFRVIVSLLTVLLANTATNAIAGVAGVALRRRANVHR